MFLITSFNSSQVGKHDCFLFHLISGLVALPCSKSLSWLTFSEAVLIPQGRKTLHARQGGRPFWQFLAEAVGAWRAVLAALRPVRTEQWVEAVPGRFSRSQAAPGQSLIGHLRLWDWKQRVLLPGTSGLLNSILRIRGWGRFLEKCASLHGVNVRRGLLG